MLARPPLARLVALGLRHCAFECAIAATVEDAHRLIDARVPRLAVIEIAGDPSATALLHLDVASIALVELERGGSSFAAFGAGAAQVVRIPFTPDELAVRAAVLARRTGTPTVVARSVVIDGIELNLDEYVELAGRRIALGPARNSLLYLLVANIGYRLSRDEIRTLAWGIDREATDRRVDELVLSLADTVANTPLRVTIGAAGVGIGRIA